MAAKKQYYKLDDIGIVGTQSKVSKAQMKKDMELTSQFFAGVFSDNKRATEVFKVRIANHVRQVHHGTHSKKLTHATQVTPSKQTIQRKNKVTK